MKRLLDYLAESEFSAKRPVPGDRFSISINTDVVVESVVSEITEQGDFYIELNESGLQTLIAAGVINENFEQLLPHNQRPQNQTPTDGHMSPINGNAFKPYDRNENPHTWFKRDVERKNKEPEQEEDDDDGFQDAIRGLHEAKIFVRTSSGVVESTLNSELVKKSSSHQWFCRAW